MSATGPILILEDDEDDQEILEIVFNSLEIRNERKYFESSDDFLVYLMKTKDKPLIIFSDINMAKANGIDLKRRIEADSFLKSKTIPYVFLTTSASPTDVTAAFELKSQGYFVKSPHVDEMSKRIHHIICYWKESLHPNNV